MVREGTLLNKRYRVLNLLGEGGMAAVYRAEDTVLGRTVAIKVLRGQLARDEAFLSRFRDEARSAASLSHPSIVGVYDVGEDDSYRYIVMEYVGGPTLKEVITREAPLPIDRAVALTQQVLGALETAHQRGIVHRDVKPQNVLLTADGQAKVTDFGIARQLAAAGQTQGGEVFGTAAYLAPERASGHEATAASDVYAVGVMLYEMLTGHPPFTGDSPVELALKHVREEPLPPSRKNAAVPAQLEAVVLQALAKDPARRFRSAREMAVALGNYADSAAAMTAPLALGNRVKAAPVAAPAVPLQDQAPKQARGFSCLMLSLVAATVVLIVLLVPLGRLFADAFIFPLMTTNTPVVATQTPAPGATASAVTAASATAGAAVTATASPTATATVTPAPTSTPLPIASPTPQYPAWMRFDVAAKSQTLVSSDQPQLSEVRGRVVDQNGRLVPNLRLRIEAGGGWKDYRPRTGIDAADGNFRFDQLSPGNYRVTVVDQYDNPISRSAEDLVTNNVPRDFKGYVVWEITFRQVQ